MVNPFNIKFQLSLEIEYLLNDEQYRNRIPA